MKIKIDRYINKECVSVGFCIDWNYWYGLEIDFFFWRIDIQFGKRVKRTQ